LPKTLGMAVLAVAGKSTARCDPVNQGPGSFLSDS
jgi:hypothetical protein